MIIVNTIIRYVVQIEYNIPVGPLSLRRKFTLCSRWKIVTKSQTRIWHICAEICCTRQQTLPSGIVSRWQEYNKYCHVTEWLCTEFGLVIGFTEHLQIATTSNYSAIANSHTLHFATERTKSSQFAVSSPVVVW
jgi:hypothetical protein